MLRTQHLPAKLTGLNTPGITSLLALATLMATLGGCGGASNDKPIEGGSTTSAPVSGTASPTAVVEAQKANTPVDPAIATADNAFGLNLLNTLIPGSSGGNVAISPLSVALALQIVYNGAAGSTQTAMAQTLQLGSLSTADLNNDNAALHAALLNPDANVQLTMANSLWMRLADNPVLTSFIDTDQTYYGATIGDLSGAPANVNAWVSSETQGLITELFPGATATFYETLIAVVANTIYFKGEWTSAFDPTLTAAAPFTLSDGTKVTAQLMNQTASFDYFQGSLQGTTFQALRLPYGSGRLNMLIVLTAAGASLDTFVANVTPAVLTGWNSQFTNTYGSVALPRFDATYGQALDNALGTLGMGAAFCMNDGDLPGISPGACLAKIEHQTVIEVDEAGTVAAGSTGGGIGITAIPSPQFTMTMNRPFFYAIQDSTTGVLIFIGVLMNPVQTSGSG
jgi:serine protease inhibitor